jgi:hypothetical protein
MRKVSFILGTISALVLIFPALSLSQVTYVIDLSEPYSYLSGTNPIPNTSWRSDYDYLPPKDDGYFDLSLGNFAFQFYGTPVTTLRISTNGYITVGTMAVPPQEGQESANYPICNYPTDPTPCSPTPPPHGLIAPFWDDLDLTHGGQVRWGISGISPYRQLVVEWVNVPSYNFPAQTYSFEAILYESTDKIKFQYLNVPDGGAFSTVGVENFDGTSGAQFSYNTISVAPGVVIQFSPKVTRIFFDDFSTETGWTGYEPGGWHRLPAAAGGGENGYPDPGVDHSPSTDNYILGFAIGADYPNSLVEKSIISPPIDCTVQDRVFLKFWRYLNVESNQYDHARVYVSNDWTNWTQLWENPVFNVTDNQWTQVVFDISSIAAHQGTVYIKFTMGPTNATARYSGWNIDDVEVTSDYNGPMALYVPSGGIPNPNIDEIMIKNGLSIKHSTTIPTDLTVLSDYDLLIVSDDGACNPTTANHIGLFLQYGGGVILMGGTPNPLAGNTGNTGDLLSIIDWFGAGTYGNDCGYANPVVDNPLETPLSVNDKLDSTSTNPCGSASVDNLNPESMKISAWSVGGTTHSFVHSYGLGNLFYYAGNPGYSGDSNPITIGNGLTLFEAGLFWAVAGCAMPSITIQPQSQMIQSGQTATLSVWATDATSLNYQWYQGASGDTSSLISGATSSSYTTSALAQTTSYWVRVSNACGSYTDSDTAIITVEGSCTAPNITAQPQSQAIQSGQTASMSVSASGTTPFSYQWYQGVSGDTSNPVSGASSASYTTPALTQTTSYWVRVTNSCGNADSNTATITVTAATVGISVVSPNGGEAWPAGSIQTIRWTCTGNPGAYVKIELLKAGVLNSTIVSRVSKGTGESGSRTWTIPSNLTPGNDYAIRVTSTTNGAYTDTSDSDFTIASPTITVVSPNGGETWTAGSAQTIRWSYTGNPGSYVRVELLKGGVVNCTIASSASKGKEGSGSRNWKIPATLAPGNDYAIRVTSKTNSAFADASDSEFTIAAPIISVVSPNGGEIWSPGSVQTIRWTYTGNPGSYVKIELLKGGVVDSTIASRVSKGSGGSGSRNWTIPANQATGTDYRIRITSTTNGACSGMSEGDFAIQ